MLLIVLDRWMHSVEKQNSSKNDVLLNENAHKMRLINSRIEKWNERKKGEEKRNMSKWYNA